jgi:radical SAM-linked protein
VDAPPTTEAEPVAAAAPSAPEPRQRWRLTYARELPPGESSAVGREYLALWEHALEVCGLQVVTGPGGRPKVSLAAALPVGTSALADQLDVWLAERVPAWRLREALTPLLPAGHRLVSLEDTWLGAPPLAGRIAAADYLVDLNAASGAADIAAAAARLLAASHLPRERTKGGGRKMYDLRPLILDLGVVDDGPPVRLRLRARIHPELGTGRPDEVVAALEEELGVSLAPVSVIRERLLLDGDLEGELAAR